MKKLAVIFPGVGYHADKPLLYYSKKIAAHYGYEIVEVAYGKLPKKVKGSKEKMEKTFRIALDRAEDILKNVDFSEYDDILFISKSVGTVVASAYAGMHHLKTRNVYYTPVEASFQFMTQQGIVFTGTADTWVAVSRCMLRRTEIILWRREMCRKIWKTCSRSCGQQRATLRCCKRLLI